MELIGQGERSALAQTVPDGLLGSHLLERFHCNALSISAHLRPAKVHMLCSVVALNCCIISMLEVRPSSTCFTSGRGRNRDQRVF